MFRFLSRSSVVDRKHRSEDTTDWLLTDKVTSWVGTPSDRGWRYLRQSLERHDGPDTSLRYSKVVFETITGLERTSTPPPWLVQRLEVRVQLPCHYFRKSHSFWSKNRSMISSGLFGHACASSCSSWRWSLRCPLSIKYVSLLNVAVESLLQSSSAGRVASRPGPTQNCHVDVATLHTHRPASRRYE